MLPLEPRQQKIVIKCLVEYDGLFLLWRGSKLASALNRDSIGYFGIPSFELTYGANPQELIRQELITNLNHEVTNIQILDVIERMIDPNTQVVDLLYRTKVTGEYNDGEIETSHYIFIAPEQFEQYMFPHELLLIKRWLS